MADNDGMHGTRHAGFRLLVVRAGPIAFGEKTLVRQGRTLMKKITLLATVLGLWPALGVAQTMDELVNDGKNTDNVLNHSMGLDRKSYSPLKQINKTNINRRCRVGAPA